MIRILIFRLSLLAGILLASANLAADPVTITYGLWDSNQQPAYQKAADVFMAKNPDIKIEIQQLGWGDYWTGLQTGMVAGTAADVFWDHLAKYPDFQSKGQLVDLAPYVKRDGLDTSIYLNHLGDLWSKDGHIYGMPKDWDTITIIYNKEMVKAAGYTEAQINNLTWNPKDGGTFEKFIAKLSFDKNGNDGLSPKFDPNNVVRYGFALNHSDDRGQAQFSPFAVSTGWMYTDGTFNHNFHYDDPRFIATIDWMVSVTKKGYMAGYEATASQANPLFVAKKTATTFDGSWMIGFYSNNAGFPVGFARLPVGPVGRRSMINGLADSIGIASKHKEEAWRWVKFLASEESQKIVGSFGVVFPAIQSGVNAALATYKTKNVDVSAFTDEALTKNVAFLYPVVDNGVKIGEIMTSAFDSIFTFKAAPKDALTDANKKVMSLYK
jgi:multiple sugar transport system substrate-binding protein